MNLAYQLGASAGVGLSLALLFSVWSVVSARSKSWPSLIRGMSTLIMLAWALATVVGASIVASSLQSNRDYATAAVGLLVGLLLPGFLKKKNTTSATDVEDVVPVEKSTNKSKKSGKSSGIQGIPQFQKLLKNQKLSSRLSVAGVPLPTSLESGGLLVAGAESAHKVQLMASIIQQLRAANDTVVVFDPRGELLQKAFNSDTDFLFNPMDSRSVGWSPLHEVAAAEANAESVARVLVPDHSSSQPEQVTQAQAFVAQVLRKTVEKHGSTALAEFLYYIQSANTWELQSLLSGTAARNVVTLQSFENGVRALASARLACLSYLPSASSPFAASAMVEAEHEGVLFLTPSDTSEFRTMQPLYEALIDSVARAMANRKPSTPGHKVWLVAMEYPLLGKLSTVHDLALRGNTGHFGVALSVSSLPELGAEMGPTKAAEFLDALATVVVVAPIQAGSRDYVGHRAQVVEDSIDLKAVLDRASGAQPLLVLPQGLGLVLGDQGRPPKEAIVPVAALVARNFKEHPQVVVRSAAPEPSRVPAAVPVAAQTSQAPETAVVVNPEPAVFAEPPALVVPRVPSDSSILVERAALN